MTPATTVDPDRQQRSSFLSKRSVRLVLTVIVAVQVGLLGHAGMVPRAAASSTAGSIPNENELTMVVKDVIDTSGKEEPLGLHHAETAEVTGKGSVRARSAKSPKASRNLRPKEDKADKAKKEKKTTKAPKGIAPTVSAYPSSSPTESPTMDGQ